MSVESKALQETFAVLKRKIVRLETENTDLWETMLGLEMGKADVAQERLLENWRASDLRIRLSVSLLRDWKHVFAQYPARWIMTALLDVGAEVWIEELNSLDRVTESNIRSKIQEMLSKWVFEDEKVFEEETGPEKHIFDIHLTAEEEVELKRMGQVRLDGSADGESFTITRHLWNGDVATPE